MTEEKKSRIAETLARTCNSGRFMARYCETDDPRERDCPFSKNKLCIDVTPEDWLKWMEEGDDND